MTWPKRNGFEVSDDELKTAFAQIDQPRCPGY